MIEEARAQLDGVFFDLRDLFHGTDPPDGRVAAIEQLQQAGHRLLSGERPRDVARPTSPIALTEREAREVVTIVSRVPSVYDLFGGIPSSAQMLAYGEFLATLHASLMSYVFRNYPELVPRQPTPGDPDQG